MKWVVGEAVTSQEGNGPLPAHLADLFEPGGQLDTPF
jgi:hypothetical protein